MATPGDRPTDRTERALHGVDLEGRGLEIGPSHAPLVPKSSGRRIETLDHAPRDVLVAKYRAHGIEESSLARVDEVDHLWNGGSLLDVIPEHGVYDYIVASHFVEHTVDLIGFLQDCQALLSPTGRLALVVPDKRFTFDFFRPLSSLGAVVDQHLTPTRFHPPGASIDQLAYLARRGEDSSWAHGDSRPIGLIDPGLPGFPLLMPTAVAQEEYLDVHRWVFTDVWFELLIRDLTELGYIDLEIVESFDTEGIEFFVTLARRSETAPRTTEMADRLELLSRVSEQVARVGLLDRGSSVEQLQSENDRLTGEIAALRASTSWRVTRPLRGLSRRLRRS